MARGGARPGAGRKRTDPDLKKLRGTERADRALVPAAPAAVGTMIPPLHLGETARTYFGDIAAMLEEKGRAAQEFAPHVALLAQRLEQIHRWQAVLEMEGDTYVARTGMIKARPEVAMLSDAMRQAQSLIGELMLNPSAALRIASSREDEGDDFDGF
jgi:phage terminase small subunit